MNLKAILFLFLVFSFFSYNHLSPAKAVLALGTPVYERMFAGATSRGLCFLPLVLSKHNSSAQIETSIRIYRI